MSASVYRHESRLSEEALVEVVVESFKDSMKSMDFAAMGISEAQRDKLIENSARVYKMFTKGPPSCAMYASSVFIGVLVGLIDDEKPEKSRLKGFLGALEELHKNACISAALNKLSDSTNAREN